MSTHALGPFEVKMEPQEPDDKAPGSTLGRLSLSKNFQGDLEGTSKGQMLTAMSDVEGFAGYVAIERVTGRLHGRGGSFVLQHSGMMTPDDQNLSLTVVPGSGAGQLAGIAGSMVIKVVEGNHSYDLEYSLPEPPVG